MKNLLLIFSVLLSYSLFSQEFLSIHISDSASNSSDIRTNINLEYQDIDEIQSELKIASILLLADLDYYLVIDDSTTNSYENHPNPSQVNLKKYKTTSGDAFVVISGTNSIDGKYILDDFFGELNIIKESYTGYDRGNITIEGEINVPFEGDNIRLNLTSPRLWIQEDIINDPLNALDVNQFTPAQTIFGGNIRTSWGIVELERGGASAFAMSKYSSAESALASFSINSDLLDYDGDGYAAWRDDDDNNPSINQANNIYTLPSALNEIALLQAQKNAALSAQASAEAERDARPTQASFDAVVAERDARPTQNAYDALVAENSEKYNLKDIADLRAGSKMIEIVNGQASLSMDVESSDELGSWTIAGNLSTVIPIQAGVDKKFYRFKMDDSDSSDKDINLSIGDSEYDEAAIIEALAEQYGVPASSISLSVTGG